MSASVLDIGGNRGGAIVDDVAFVRAMLQVELAWMRVQRDHGLATDAHLDAVRRAADAFLPQASPLPAPTIVEELAAEAEAGGNPVQPLVRRLRAAVGPSDAEAAQRIHLGLTSQDVLDSALMLLARDALEHLRSSSVASLRALRALAERHRHSAMAGRTLGQHATPITFGLKAAHWADGIADAVLAIDARRAALPVQCGGAAGTLARIGLRSEHPLDLAEAFGAALGLAWPGTPWQTNRTQVTSLGDALVTSCDAFGRIANDVVLLSRPEIAELREGAVDGRGGSSTMPHKRNPVLSILIRQSALRAPMLGASLHLAASGGIDERPEGAWHAEWPTLQQLLRAALGAGALGSELLSGIEVDAEAMRRRVEAAKELTAERDGAAEAGPALNNDYLGATAAIVDRTIARIDALLDDEEGTP